MSKIYQKNKCEDCIHKQVCQYRLIREEIFDKMLNRLDNCYCPNMLKFSFECLNYKYYK